MDSSFVRPDLEDTSPYLEPPSTPVRSWRTWLIGRPLSTADAPHEAVGKGVGLAVFSSDALSSTAYATQEIMLILAFAGAAAFSLVFPISLAIVFLLVIVTISYEQTIHAYPGGGGAYIVSRDNLGTLAAQVAAACLLMDYILTVAVSISAGLAQITSAFPGLFPYRIIVAAVLVFLVMGINLRGVRESGVFFAIPTYFFIVVMYGTVIFAFGRWAFGAMPHVVDPPIHELESTAAIGMFLVLHAFASGTTALTGVEAISNGISAFREPRSRNAGITLILMACILGTLFLSISFLAPHIGAVPSDHETIISQLARATFDGRNALYLAVIAATTVILVMAANTAFAGFPRLAALQAADGYLPKQLTYRGSRLVFSRGIVALAVVATLLIVAFQARVSSLIPLYAIGVFASFTLSQAGMCRRWRKSGRLAPGESVQESGSILRPDRHWRIKMILNGFGAALTAVVTGVFAVTKFHDGAWIILILIPLLVAFFYAIHRHYRELAGRLSLEDYGPPPRVDRHRVILPISGVHRGTLAGLRYARALSEDVTAIYVSMDLESSAALEKKWGLWGSGVRLVILKSPYRLLVEPLIGYVRLIATRRQPNEVITVVVPQFVPNKRWHNLLHSQTAMFLRIAFVFEPGVVITSVPYRMQQDLELE